MADLPALSEDGRQVAIRYEHGDGLRGFPNRELMVIDAASDTIAKRIHVLDADEVNNPTAPPSSDVEWAQREHEANAYLAKRRWRKLAAYSMNEDLTASDKLKERVIAQVQEASGEGLRVRFHEPNLFLEIDRKPAVGRAHPSWIMRPFRPCPRCDICPSQVARINAAFGNRRRGILLIELNHTSNSDMCTEDRPVWHVVPLPKSGP